MSHLSHWYFDILPIDWHCMSYEHGFVSLTMMHFVAKGSIIYKGTLGKELTLYNPESPSSRFESYRTEHESTVKGHVLIFWAYRWLGADRKQKLVWHGDEWDNLQDKCTQFVVRVANMSADDSMFEKWNIFECMFYCVFFGLESRMKHIFLSSLWVHICFYNLRSGGASFSDGDKLRFQMRPCVRTHPHALKCTHRHTHASKALGSGGTADIVVPSSL